MSLMQYPPDGDDPTSAFFPPSFRINVTALNIFGYQYWSNDTISNSSVCILVGSPIAPNPSVFIAENGTWVNATWCDWPLNDIGTRGIVSLALVVPYALALMLSLVALRRLGTLHLPSEKRFRPIGRRWQWYWALFVCAFAVIGLVMNVDVDRAYVLSLHIIISVFTWYLMQMGATAVVWEAVRHWGSWRERMTVDPDPFAMREDDRRSKVEFWLPLTFYFFLWMNFFVLMPRNWGPIELQRAPNQTPFTAIPTATDGRFKAGGFVLVVCFCIIIASLWHSVRHYFLLRTVTVTETVINPRPSLFMSTVGWMRHVPLHLWIMLVALAGQIAYQILCAFVWDVSLLNIHGSFVATFVGGYAPTIVILLTQCTWGLWTKNEDKKIMEMRRSRGIEMDRELGVSRKPGWWRLVRGTGEPEAQAGSAHSAPAVATMAPQSTGLRAVPGMGTNKSNMPASPTSLNTPGTPGVPNALGAADGGAESDRIRDLRAELMSDGLPPPPTYSEAVGRAPRDGDSVLTGDTLRTPPPPQQVRSMLDV